MADLHPEGFVSDQTEKGVTEKRWAWLDTAKSKLIYIHAAGKSKRECLGIFRSDDERIVRVTISYEVPS